MTNDSAHAGSIEHLLRVVQELSAARDLSAITAIIEAAAPHHPSETGTALLRGLADASATAIAHRDRFAGLEARLAERTGQLEATHRELEAFAYAVSHDLRAPLRVITGFSRALLEDHAVALGDGKRHLDRIYTATGRMTMLLDDLLRFTRMTGGALDRASIDLAPVALEILEELHHGEPARKVDLRVPPALPAHGDPRLLRALLENLLGNAWKFTARRERSWIEIGARDGAFFVRDNGIGFDDSHADKLFTPFYRLHSAAEFEGSGVGLAIAQRIVHRHGGRIWAEGAPDRGATFYFTLG